jgi:hypothetical protein
MYYIYYIIQEEITMSIKQVRFLFPGLPWEEHVLYLEGKEYKLFFAKTHKVLCCFDGRELITLPL